MARRILVAASIIIFLLPLNGAISSDLDAFNLQIKEKQEAMRKLEAQIEIYKKNIQEKQNETVTLANQLAILNSQIMKTELDIKITEIQIEQLDLEIQSLASIIKEKQLKFDKEKQLLAYLIRQININQPKNYLNVILSGNSFAEYFNQIKYLEDISNDLNQTLKQVKADKEELQIKQDIALRKKEIIEKLKKTLVDRKANLEEQKKAKDYLLINTRSSENKFKILLAQLRQEYSQFDQEVVALQQQLEKKLSEAEQLGGALTVLSWPVDPIEGITAYFHDPTYPFRYLFEHPGVDVRASQGTPVAAAASGYVAWVRSTRLYGNNIMIIHSGGFATLYAHLSQFRINEDTFVKRGEIIGLSGGMPGTPGAGFSTGPHLHFEVRENGIPVDPMNYLIR